jgi:glycosyltransferase involved in cell wall biosynthesis
MTAEGSGAPPVKRRLPVVSGVPAEAPGARPKALVFLPARDEEESVGATVARLREVQAEARASMTLDSLLIDDGSRDDATRRAALAAGIDRVVQQERGRGLGATTRMGLVRAWAGGYAAAVKLDADGRYDPRDIPALLAPILEGRADLVWGVRARIEYRMPLVRRAGNRALGVVMRALTAWPVSDPQTGLMAFSARFLDGFLLGADYNPPQLLLLDGARRGLRYAEHPVSVGPRRAGRSFVTWRYPFSVTVNLLRYAAATRTIR